MGWFYFFEQFFNRNEINRGYYNLYVIKIRSKYCTEY